MKNNSFDHGQYARQTRFRLIAGVFLIILVIGPLLVYAIYGKNASISSLLCIGGALVPVVIIGFLLWALDIALKKRKG